ncbi:MAG: LCP family protein [Treponema sp.]|jgi:anionic cell wall polymer biosynthesis LytR-Cps2A-Psr (LCP) family protein|nr:LCP family protein [Treponema sp.]
MRRRLRLHRASKRDASVVFLSLIVLLAGGGIMVGVLFINYDPIQEALASDQVINTLFIFEGEPQNGAVKPLNSFLLMYYPATKRAAVFDIPGQIGLILTDINRVDRIDSIYNPENIDVYRNEISSFIGDEIDYSIVYNLDTLEKTVDLLEGVELFIPAPVEMYDSRPPVLFASGLCRLDGKKIRSYLTYKLPQEGDEAVNLRRQRFFYAFIKRLGEQNRMLKQTSVAKMFHRLMKSAMSERERERLFDEYSNINMDRVSIQSVAGTTREVSGQVLLLPSYNGNLIKEVIRQTLVNLTAPIEGQFSDRVYTIEVLNGTTINGLAGRTAELLRGFGYDVVSVGNTDASHDNTLIIDQLGYQVAARNLGSIIRCSAIQVREVDLESDGVEDSGDIKNYKSDFILIIGRDFNGRYVVGG